MKMSNPGICCDSCFYLIAKSSPEAAKLWLDLCDLQILSNDIFGLMNCNEEILKILEIFGFILTTETSDVILVKVFGKKEDSSGIYFCGGSCEIE